MARKRKRRQRKDNPSVKEKEAAYSKKHRDNRR